jgi:TonB family protein
VGYQSVVALWLVIDQDGLPQDIRIVRPAGMGLDEAAVDTVRMWRFDPARKDGDAVRVQMRLEVNFHLY